MNFKAKTADEIKADKLMPEGVYPFEVNVAADKSTKKEVAKAEKEGRKPELNMISMELTVYVNGKSRKQRDVIGTWGGGAEKIRSFCETTGLMDKYNNGTLEASDCIGAQGYARIGKENSEQYGPQNTVRLYLSEEDAQAINARISGAAPIQSAAPVAATDDDVPF